MKWERIELTRPFQEDDFGSVFPAISPEGFPLVVKSSTSVKRSRFLEREKSILENFRLCPEIINCYGGSFRDKNGSREYNLVLEYASRGCLYDLMKRHGGKIPEPYAAYYTKMIMKGLYEIHKRNIVHCDLKPERIMVFHPQELGELSELKIANFGSAKLPGEEEEELNHQLRRFLGTPNYMSPEAVTDGKIGTAMDVWSLGCIVVEMITGEKPWEEIDDEILLMMKIGTLKQSPNIPNDLSEDGKDFLKKCFEVNHEKRSTIDMLLKHPFVAKEYEIDANIENCTREEEVYRHIRRSISLEPDMNVF